MNSSLRAINMSERARGRGNSAHGRDGGALRPTPSSIVGRGRGAASTPDRPGVSTQTKASLPNSTSSLLNSNTHATLRDNNGHTRQLSTGNISPSTTNTSSLQSPTTSFIDAASFAAFADSPGRYFGREDTVVVSPPKIPILGEYNTTSQPSSTLHRSSGTKMLKFDYHRETDTFGVVQTWQSISVLPEYKAFSFEELRLLDCCSNTETCEIQVVPKESPHCPLHLLNGSAVEIVVGTIPAGLVSNASSGRWVLPIELVCRHSSRLQDVCSEARYNIHNTLRITLEDQYPHTFSLFVEWMYFGYYGADPTSVNKQIPQARQDAQAWVLGNALQATKFKDYAMSRLYDQYTRRIAPSTITPSDALYVFENTQLQSKLRCFYVDFLTQHFTDSNQIKGSVEEWDQVFVSHPDVRRSFLTSLRSGTDKITSRQPKCMYMEEKQNIPAEIIQLPSNNVAVPAKRNSAGVLVKDELKSP